MCYCVAMLDRRLQLLLDEERYEKLTRLAREQQVSVAEVIRRAIDRLPGSMERREAAITAILAADPVPVPEDPSELRAELDEAHLAS
jgi:signal transduction histidine kinase